MTLLGRGLAVLLPALALGGCAWAPFPESLLDRADAGAEAEGRPNPGAADDPNETTHAGDLTGEDAGTGAEPARDAGGDALDPESRKGTLRTSGEVEPNDSMTSAQEVGLFYTVLAEWTPAGDDDWYAVDLLAGDVLDIRTRADDGGCDFDSILLVYPEGAQAGRAITTCGQSDPAALACVDDVDDSPCARATFVAETSGTYYVRVVEYGDDEHALYTIDFELMP